MSPENLLSARGSATSFRPWRGSGRPGRARNQAGSCAPTSIPSRATKAPRKARPNVRRWSTVPTLRWPLGLGRPARRRATGAAAVPRRAELPPAACDIFGVPLPHAPRASGNHTATGRTLGGPAGRRGRHGGWRLCPGNHCALGQRALASAGVLVIRGDAVRGGGWKSLSAFCPGPPVPPGGCRRAATVRDRACAGGRQFFGTTAPSCRCWCSRRRVSSKFSSLTRYRVPDDIRGAGPP